MTYFEKAKRIFSGKEAAGIDRLCHLVAAGIINEWEAERILFAEPTLIERAVWSNPDQPSA